MTDDTLTQENPPVETAPIVPTAPVPEKEKTRQMSFTILADGTVRAEFGEGLEPVSLLPTEIPESIYAAAVTEGIISRARGYTSKLVDKERTPANLRERVILAFTNLKAGIWKIERSGDGSEAFSIEQEAAFLFRVSRVASAKAKAAKDGVEYTAGEAGTLEESAEAFSKLTDDQKKQLKALPRYQLAFAEVKAKRAEEKRAALQKKVDAEEENSPM